MAYKIVKTTFEAYNGTNLDYFRRKDTNDLNTIASIVVNDEYHTEDMTYSEGDVFVDIGAHIGGWAKLMRSLVPNCGIIAVEPLPENIELLKSNVDGEIIEKAIANRSDTTRKIHYGDNTESGKHHKYIGNVVMLGVKSEEYVKVPAISLNDLLKNVKSVRVMKMDCEGGEYSALRFASRETLDKIDYIIGEYHNPDNEKTKTRKALHKATKGLFEDISESKKDTPLGQFWFKNKRL